MKKIVTILAVGVMLLGGSVTMPEQAEINTTIQASAANSTKSITNATISGIKNKYYTGKAVKLSLSVKVGSKTLTEGVDYTVSYKNNKAVGKASVTIKGKGKYSGKVIKTFKICPKKTTLKSVSSPASGKLKVTYSKQSGVSGYQITYATDKSFTKNKASRSSTKLSKTITGLKAGKTYYVKVRTFKTVNDVRYYSGYSEVKKVKIKAPPPTSPIGNGYECYFYADTDFDGDIELVEVYASEEPKESYGTQKAMHYVRTFRIYDSKTKYTDKTISYPSSVFGGIGLALIKDNNTKKTIAAAMGSHQYPSFNIYTKVNAEILSKPLDSKNSILSAYINYISGNYSGKLVKGVDYEIVHKLNGKTISKKKYREYFSNLEILYIFGQPDLYEWGYNYDNKVDTLMKTFAA